MFAVLNPMEEFVDLLPLPDDPASLLWLENEVLDLDLLSNPVPDVEEDAAAHSTSLLPSTSANSCEPDDFRGSDLRVVLRFDKPANGNTTAKAVAKAPAAGRKSYRQRQKQEIQLLRAHVADLQNELTVLQQGESSKEVSSGSSMRSEPVPGSLKWQRVVKQECQMRELAEEENRKLRQTVQERIRMAKSLERLLLQHEMIRTVRGPSSMGFCITKCAY